MKNPFFKEESNVLEIVAAGIFAAITAGAITYFYKKRKTLAAAAAYKKEHATDYLKTRVPKKKKHKTDIHDLASLARH